MSADFFENSCRTLTKARTVPIGKNLFILLIYNINFLKKLASVVQIVGDVKNFDKVQIFFLRDF